MSKSDFLTVEQLNIYISNIFFEETLLHNVPVLGEVSGCSVVAGHCYFTLKDAKAQIKVCFFNCAQGYVPREGEQVLVRGRVDYFGKNGQISLKVCEILPYGKGKAYAELEKLKERLRAEGLFDDAHKKPLPEKPQRIAVITSTKGAALHDFLTTARMRNELIDITAIDVRVQGAECVNDIITALRNADRAGFDVIVLTRGGGSFEELNGFNDESMARTIFNMSTPIISAVGHETDYCICDFVSDYRAITPTAAAERVAFSVTAIKEHIKNLLYDISFYVNSDCEKKITRVENASIQIRNYADVFYKNQTKSILSMLNLIKIQNNTIFNTNSANYYNLCAILEELSPIKLQNKGYFRILKDGNIIFDDSKININDKITILGNKKKIEALVVKKEDR